MPRQEGRRIERRRLVCAVWSHFVSKDRDKVQTRHESNMVVKQYVSYLFTATMNA